ncbi:MAG: threonine ammonia-lyase, biosynthetic [Xanthomonadales bacterium]|nr:L-threonine dehydratase biosynthetic IlvA [Xanthomonadales bacterium]MCC6594696.1 threonine ammonia-lyase, biosynthetic [Xanthomonadales bacterium]MCE7931883.1 threonine ammonia-lyase, biosynthetic [Xanthomonadales bacterium PRO6]
MPEPMPDYLRAVLTSRVYEVAIETALTPMQRLSRRLGHEVLLKREDLQPVFSFKLRGAYNKMAGLSQAERAAGVLAVSAGNHAQGVALAARKLGCRATIVMPSTTPSIKVDAVAALGAQIVLEGDGYDAAAAHGQRLAAERGLTFVHPYDDPAVIAGQGTVAMELLRAHPGRLDAVFIPVGGGGLAAGMAAYIKALRPEIRVIGVEPVDAACLDAALKAGQPVTLDQVGLFVDGVAVRRIGDHPFRVLREHIDAMVLVHTDEICAAIKDVFDDTRVVLEPAGALALAGLKRYAEGLVEPGATLCAVASGANVNFDRLRHIAERAEIGEAHEAVLGVTIPERPGSFLDFCRALGPRSVTEFNYRFASGASAQIYVGIALRHGAAERAELIGQLAAAGFPVVDYTDNELAKLHVRHMVGGRAEVNGRERVYRFEFPERPGALLRFLERLGTRWNITLFHYRSHGAAYGRVFCGIEVADGADEAELHASLQPLGYDCVDETANPVVSQFLRA